jgi:hypothetical protein
MSANYGLCQIWDGDCKSVPNMKEGWYSATMESMGIQQSAKLYGANFGWGLYRRWYCYRKMQ